MDQLYSICILIRLSLGIFGCQDYSFRESTSRNKYCLYSIYFSTDSNRYSMDQDWITEVVFLSFFLLKKMLEFCLLTSLAKLYTFSFILYTLLLRSVTVKKKTQWCYKEILSYIPDFLIFLSFNKIIWDLM